MRVPAGTSGGCGTARRWFAGAGAGLLVTRSILPCRSTGRQSADSPRLVCAGVAGISPSGYPAYSVVKYHWSRWELHPRCPGVAGGLRLSAPSWRGVRLIASKRPQGSTRVAMFFWPGGLQPVTPGLMRLSPFAEARQCRCSVVNPAPRVGGPIKKVPGRDFRGPPFRRASRRFRSRNARPGVLKMPFDFA